MSTTPPPEPAPSVPYGPDADATPAPLADPAPLSSAGSTGRTVLKWTLRALLPILIRAVFRALARR